MPSALPVLFARDLARLKTLPAGRLVMAQHWHRSLYDFSILEVQRGPDGAWERLVIYRSGVTLEVWQDGRIVPATTTKKVG